MEAQYLEFKNKEEFRSWLATNHKKVKEVFVLVKKGKPTDNPRHLYYLDAVETALCFGWIDSQFIEYEGKRYQRFSPRRKSSPWSELNKERVRRLIKLGLLDESAKKSLPKLGPRSFKIDVDIVNALKKARCYKTFKSFPDLYQRVRAYNVTFYKKSDPTLYQKSLIHLINETKKGKMYGEWNDYGRLLDY